MKLATLGLSGILGLGTLGAAPHDCIMTPLAQHVRAVRYLVVGTVQANLDASTPEGREYRQLCRFMPVGRDSVTTCVTATFRAGEVLKGEVPPGADLTVVSGQVDGATRLEVGSRYVLFLSRVGQRYVVTTCSYSNKLGPDSASGRLLRQIRAARYRR